LPIYTALFNRLGIAALVCTLIAIAVLPLMKRLSAAHSAQAAVERSGAGGGLPTIAAEE
jgi:POT family proton-dependent oligopeptide transporter